MIVSTAADRSIPLPLDACIGLTGRTLSGRYRICGLLAHGGMGAIYEAEHLTTGRRYAIKALLDQAASSDEIVRRFEREAMATQRLAHPNLVQVLDVGAVEDATLYLVMELVAGPTLREVLASGPLAARRSLVIARQILEGIGHAHTVGLVHRDLKPENVMLARAGMPGNEYEQVKVLDFGIVKLLGGLAAELAADKLTRTGVVSGTPAYMALEQALGRLVDGRADLYSLGIIVFEMLTGAAPYRSTDAMTLMRMQAAAPIPTLASVAWPHATPALEHLVARSLAKQPDDRFRDATAMIAAIDSAFISIDHLPR